MFGASVRFCFSETPVRPNPLDRSCVNVGVVRAGYDPTRTDGVADLDEQALTITNHH